MSDEVRVLFLGCGTSVGVPVIGCECEVCTSDDPRNQRLRSSIYLEGPFGHLLVDSGTDLRQQALRARLRQVDAVLYTHGHVDHVAGFDELRAFCWRRDEPLPLYGSAQTLEILGQMYPWAFREKVPAGYVQVQRHLFEQEFQIQELQITPILVEHGSMETHGFRFDFTSGKAMGYLPDVKSIPASSQTLLDHLDTLIIGGLRHDPHPTHQTVDDAVGLIRKLKPRIAYLTHLGHDLDWERESAALPDDIHLASDELLLKF